MTSILDNNVLIPKWLSTLPNNIKVVLVILIGLHVFGVLLVVLLYVAILFIITCILILNHIIGIKELQVRNHFNHLRQS